jgi:hypothetical protein
VLGERVEDELDAVVDAMPASTPLVACWTYGALAPTEHGADVLDQTICITTLAERPVSGTADTSGSLPTTGETNTPETQEG